MDTVNKFFEDHKSDNVVFETSDKLLFRQDGDAMLHAKSLKDTTVTTHTRKVALAETETAAMPVIDEIVTHDAGEGENKETITAQSLQIPVTEEVKEQLATAEKATGEPVTDTTASTETVKPATEVKAVTTATGDSAANAAAKPLTKKEIAAAKVAEAKGK